MAAGAFNRCKAHDCKGQNDQGDTGQQGPQATATEVADPQKKGRHESFPATDFAGCQMFGPTLELNHFFFES